MAGRTRAFLIALVTAITLTACGGAYQRGIFQGYVIDATEEQVTSKIGKPDQIDAGDPNSPRWVYVKKTFDPDNQNKVDEKTIIVFKKDPKTGKFIGSQVLFL
jgi:hypothetical protein